MRADQHGRNQYSPATSLRKSVDKWMSEYLSTFIHNPCMQPPYRNPWSNRCERYAVDSRSSVPITANRRRDMLSGLRFAVIVVSTGSIWNGSVLDDGFACRSARGEILNFRDLQYRNGHRLFRATFLGDLDLLVIDRIVGMEHDIAAETVAFLLFKIGYRDDQIAAVKQVTVCLARSTLVIADMVAVDNGTCSFSVRDQPGLLC